MPKRYCAINTPQRTTGSIDNIATGSIDDGNSDGPLKLLLLRTTYTETYTAGKLFYVGKLGSLVHIADTIEDKNRDLNRNGIFDNGEKKVPTETCIPFGTYQITMNIVSPKYSKKEWFYKNCFGGKMPRLLNVPSFEGILIHSGSSARSSAGCLIVGKSDGKGRVTNSQEIFLKLYQLLWRHRNSQIQIQIK